MVVEDMREFQPGQRVRVLNEGGASSSQPDKRWLGSEGFIRYSPWTPLEGSPPTFFYFVEFDSGEVEPISPDWLEPR